jgi:riboflavin kinase/FMN adenylyltransferase
MEKVYLDYHKVVGKSHKLTLLLGNFDGLHRGHLELVIAGKKATEGDLGVLLFDKNPADFFLNGKSHSVLTSLDDRLRLFEGQKLEVAYILKIDKAFFDLSPEDFIEKILKPLQPERIIVGTDYTFGKDAAGSDDLLKKAFAVDEVSLLDYEGKKVSTQRIIADLASGDLASANGQLGRDYEIHGTIAHGYENGRKMGFPTANLSFSTPYALPKNGVYLGLAYLRGRPYQTLINVGINPTIGLLKKPKVECYLEGFSGEAYGETLYVTFNKRLRDEMVFKSLDDLRAQMEKDKAALR